MAFRGGLSNAHFLHRRRHFTRQLSRFLLCILGNAILTGCSLAKKGTLVVIVHVSFAYGCPAHDPSFHLFQPSEEAGKKVLGGRVALMDGAAEQALPGGNEEAKFCAALSRLLSLDQVIAITCKLVSPARFRACLFVPCFL